MPSFIATGKSPCRSHPDYFGLECPNIECDKNNEPCCSCGLPTAYDERLSPYQAANKRFGDSSSIRGIVNPAFEAVNNLAISTGCMSVGEYIEKLHDAGHTYDSIAEMVNVSKSSVKRMKGRF